MNKINHFIPILFKEIFIIRWVPLAQPTYLKSILTYIFMIE